MQCLHTIKVDMFEHDNCLKWLDKNGIYKWRCTFVDEKWTEEDDFLTYHPPASLFRFQSKDDAIAFKLTFAEIILSHNIL